MSKTDELKANTEMEGSHLTDTLNASECEYNEVSKSESDESARRLRNAKLNVAPSIQEKAGNFDSKICPVFKPPSPAIVKKNEPELDLRRKNQSEFTFGRDTEATDELQDDKTSSKIALQNENDERFKLGLDRGCDINIAEQNGMTALMLASQYGNYEIVKLLLDRGCDVNFSYQNGMTSLMLASKYGRNEIVKLLLDHGCDVNIAEQNGMTALMLASMSGHDPIVQLLIERGCDVNAADRNGWTALMFASEYGKLESAKLLLKKGGNFNEVNSLGLNCLIAAYNNRFQMSSDVYELLLKEKTNLNLKNKNGHNALMIAALNGYTDLVSVLTTLTTDVNTTDNKGNSALMLALLNGNYETIKQILLEKNVDVNIKNNKSDTALMLAVEIGDEKTVKILLARGSNVNERNQHGKTALIIVSEYGHDTIVELLLQYQADVNIVDENGWNALLIASLYGQEKIIELFLSNEKVMFSDHGNKNTSSPGSLGQKSSASYLKQDILTGIVLESARCLHKFWKHVAGVTHSKMVILRSTPSFYNETIKDVFEFCKKTEIPVTIFNEELTAGERSYQCSNTRDAFILIQLFCIYFEKVIVKLNEKDELSVIQQSLPERRSFMNALKIHLEKLHTLKFPYKNKKYNENNCINLLINLLEGVFKHLTPTQNVETSQVTFEMVEEELWSSICGLKKVFGEKLHEVSPEGKEHQTESYFLKCFLQNEVDDDEVLSHVTYVDAINLAEKLKQIGFLDNTASFIANNIPPYLVERQTVLFWAFRYIDNISQYHPIISDCPRFPCNTEVTDTWFQWNVSTEYRDDDDGDDTVPVRMINLSDRQLDFAADGELTCPPNTRLLYHGTTHQGACSILKHGIVLSSGSKCQDFSYGDGFYLYFDPLKAKICGQALTLTHSAIVAFAVNEEILDPIQNKGLNLTNNGSLWLKVVQTCRSGYFDKTLKQELLNGYGFVFGPECTQPGSLFTQDAGDGSLLGDNQFCVRDEEYAIKFGTMKNIAFVIFY